MDRIVITIHPAASDEGLLSVADAMQQVLDTLKVLTAADRGAAAQDAFVWRLERASTNSPFTIVALADPVNPSVDIAPRVRAAKAALAGGIRSLVQDGEAPIWMDADAVTAMRSLLYRNRNGIGETDIDLEGGEVISIDRPKADAGLRAIAGRNVLELDSEIGEREAYGEIEGLMLAAGRYRNRPAIQIRSELYGFVWCTLSPAIVERFGGEHTMADVWDGKTVGVLGRLYYASGGKLTRIEVHNIREIEAALPVDLDSVLDPDFTAGMDVHEYLRRLHDGDLA